MNNQTSKRHPLERIKVERIDLRASALIGAMILAIGILWKTTQDPRVLGVYFSILMGCDLCLMSIGVWISGLIGNGALFIGFWTLLLSGLVAVCRFLGKKRKRQKVGSEA